MGGIKAIFHVTLVHFKFQVVFQMYASFFCCEHLHLHVNNIQV